MGNASEGRVRLLRGSRHRQEERFLEIASHFRLGDLPTEGFHPLSSDLSRLAQDNPKGALRLLHRIDAAALEVAESHLDRILALSRRMHVTLKRGNRIHLAGCGSTGRLALTCESLWRKEMAGTPFADRVTAFMAGGDSALVRALEGFEDHPEYGEKQLLEGGFGDGDLLVAASEGGETPFVIGAVERAAGISRNPPWFLYCNPDAALIRTAVRSARVIADPRVEKLALPTGPMALSGSTRMQASTVLMAAIGLALLNQGHPRRLRQRLEALVRFWWNLDTAFLAPFTLAEAGIYAEGGSLDYVADPDLAISVLTDTTERSPTFNFPPFQSALEGHVRTSPCHMLLPEAQDSGSAWRSILGREPQGLAWPELAGRASRETALGFDFSRRGAEAEPSTTHEEGRRNFRIFRTGADIEFRLDSARHRLPVPGLDPLGIHLVLKMLLNAHSTLVMGRLGRYDGNVMTWVRPTNNKLVDRAVRYADRLLHRQGLAIPYRDLVRACFALRDTLPPDRPLVPELARHFFATRRKRTAHPERRSHAGPMHA